MRAARAAQNDAVVSVPERASPNLAIEVSPNAGWRTRHPGRVRACNREPALNPLRARYATTWTHRTRAAPDLEGGRVLGARSARGRASSTCARSRQI